MLQGAKAHGWHNELGTADRVSRLIQQRFDVSFHPEHVRKILKERLHWTSQETQTGSVRERNDKEVERWKGDVELTRILREAGQRQAWPRRLPRRIGVRPDAVGAADLSAACARRRCWSAGTRRDKFSAISCVTLSPLARTPRAVLSTTAPQQDRACRGDVVAFLKEWWRQLRVVRSLWFGTGTASTNKSLLVKAFL